MWPSPCIRRLGVDVSQVLRWFLTTDADMSYTIFRGTEFPRLDRLSGKPRWLGSSHCQMVMCSVGNPEIFADVYGIRMDALECREIPPVDLRGGMAVSVSHPQFSPAPVFQAPAPVPVQQYAPPVGENVATFTEQLGGNGKHVSELIPGDWFVARCPTTGQDYVCVYVDAGMAVEFGAGREVFFTDLQGVEMVIPVKVSIAYQRLGPSGFDPRRN